MHPGQPLADEVQGFIVSASSKNATRRDSIVEHAAEHRLPAVYGRGYYADSGGLISFAADDLDLSRRSATYADKIFRGAKPGELPIEQPSKFEMVVNLRTARALGVTIPQALMVTANRLID